MLMGISTYKKRGASYSISGSNRDASGPRGAIDRREGYLEGN